MHIHQSQLQGRINSNFIAAKSTLTSLQTDSQKDFFSIGDTLYYMDLFTLFTLIAAGLSGATMGSFLLVTLLYNALLKRTDNITSKLYVYRRLYRLNTALSILGGICAALTNNRPAALMLAILGASYVFNHAHILKGLIKTCNTQYQVVNMRHYRGLSSLQNLMHLGQFFAGGYCIYLLGITTL